MRLTWLVIQAMVLLLPTAANGQGVRETFARQASYQQEREVQPPTASAPEPLPLQQQRERTTLGLADLEQIALRHNPSLVVADARHEAAQGRLVQAGLYPNPVIGYQSTEMGIRGTAGQQGGFISQRFITAGKRRLDRAVAGQEVLQVRFSFDAQRFRVLTDVRTRFYDALIAQHRLQISKQLARVGDELSAANEKLLAAQQASENTLLQAQIEADQAHIVFENAENQLTESWRRLAAVIGIPTMQVTPLSGDLNAGLPDYRWQDSLASVLGQNPELQSALAGVQRAELALERALRQRIPDVDVMVSVRHHNFTSDDVANVQVGFPIPIFNANQGNIRRARADLIAAQSAVAQIELDLQDRLAVAYRRYANARQQVEKYDQRILRRAARSLELVTAAYRQRQVDYLTLLTSQRTYYQVNLAYLDALRNFWEAASVIEGQLLRGSLARR